MSRLRRAGREVAVDVGKRVGGEVVVDTSGRRTRARKVTVR
jgi:hypothetical protein